MSTKFCPDCGAEVPNQSNRCLECKFPLTLETIAGATGVRIPPHQTESWQKISSMLRRSGVLVHQKAASEVATNKAWWALPVFGLLFFLATLVMGPTLVDRIWQPPERQFSPIVNLNQPAIGPSPSDGAATSGMASEETPEVSDDSAEFLARALRSSEEQRRRAAETRQEAQEFIEQQRATEADIRKYASQALLNVRIGDAAYFATLLNARGMFLMDRLHLSDAFEFEKKMRVTASGGVEQVTEFIKPMVFQLEGDRHPSDMVFESERIGVALLTTKQTAPLSYTLEFDKDLAQGSVVWIASSNSGNLEITQARVSGSKNQSGGILFWQIDTNFGVSQNGLPVFNEFGALTGILFQMAGGDSVISFRQLREKEPQLFQKIL